MPLLAELVRLLSKSARAALPFLEGAVEAGKGANEILKTAKELGFTIRRQVGLDIIGALKGNIDARRLIRITPPHLPLDPAHYGQALGTLLRNYSYKVLVRAVEPDTGETVNRYFTVSSNDPLSVNDVFETVDELSQGGGCTGTLSVTSRAVVDVIKSASLGV